MVYVPEDAVLDPCQFLDTVTQGYHIRLSPSTLPSEAQILYIQEMIHKIKTDDKPLIATNICRWDNTVRDFISVRRMRAGDVADIPSPMIDIDVGEL